jgi:GGDEF domain-containing protein
MANDEAPALVGHASEDPLYAELPLHTSYGVQSYVGAPVELGNGSRVGSVCAMSTQPDSYGERDLALLTIGARIIAYEWEHVTREVELRRLARRQRPRTEDPLTGLPLRDAFLDQLDREWHLTQRGITQSYLLAVTLVGLDGARAASGDALADLLLQSTGEVIVAERRRTDIAGRISDHAFGVILVGCRDAEGASAFRTRIERAFARKLSQRPEQLELTWSTQLLGDADSAAGALANVEQGLGAEPAGSVPV